MRSIFLLASLAAPLLVSARPIRSRGASKNDALVLNFANVLEELETKFYAEGIAKFQDSDFTDAGFTSSQMVSQILTVIQNDEYTHSTFLKQALKDNGVDALSCQFNFDSVLTDVTTMAATARVVEYVGVAAYLGGATLLNDPVILDAAASILTVEARHQTVLNIFAGTGSAIPQAFDIPLSPQEVLAIAGGFIDGDCNTGIQATPSLTLTNTGNVNVGTLLTFSADGMSGTDGYFCNMMTGGMPFSINLPLSQCTVPDGIDGPVVIWLTKDNNPLCNNVIDRDTSTLIGPTILFIDSDNELLGQLVRGSGTSSGATTTTTTTISPDQAGSIIQGASPTATASDSSSTSGSDSSSSGSDSSSSGNDSSSDPSSGSNVVASPVSNPLPPNYTGVSPDGKVDVLGLSSVPAPTGLSTASGSAATPSASDSAAASASTSSS